MSERDFAFEALAEVTATDWNQGRGELNAALKSIREQEPVLSDDNYLLSCEIHDRAKLYRLAMGDEILLTPSSLAKHWLRVKEQAPKKTYPAPALVYDGDGGQPRMFRCETCDNNKMVHVATRPSLNPSSGFEEWAPCPDCASGTDADFWRYDGTRFRAMDPETTRARMRTA